MIVSGMLVGAALRHQPDLWKMQRHENFHELDHKVAFVQWRNAHGRVYASFDEEAERFLVFLDNWYKVITENEKGYSHTLQLNEFADMTADEFRRYIHGSDERCVKNPEDWVKVSSEDHVGASCESVDWVSKGKVTPVKNQGGCGSCWAFSAVGCTESQYAIAHGTLNSLSEQELVDCSGSYGNAGCNGGWMDSAFKYIQANNGLALESDYKYTASDGSCKSSSYKHYNAISGYTDVSADNSDSLADAVCKGPVSIAIEADQSSFQFYSGGIISSGCGTGLDHGVLAVGFGYDSSAGMSYWKVKNSWGTGWGESGYVRICKDCGQNGNEGECGILMAPSYVNA
jgi:C1A family cysteine protease